MKIQVDEPIIKHWKRGIEIVRGGRGYSEAELDQVGLRDLRNVRNHGIPISDMKTRSDRYVKYAIICALPICNHDITAQRIA
jgi:ribosomal protein L13E